MSLPSQIILDVRRFAHVTTSQYLDADAYLDLNKIKDEFWNEVVSRWGSSNYNWDKWNTDIEANQDEYRLDIPTSTNDGMKTINNIYISDGTTHTNTGLLEYIKCREVDPKNLPNDWNFYLENQDATMPLYYQKDNSVFIAPRPTKDITNGLRIEAIRKIANWTAATTELETKLPVEFHFILELGLMPYALMSKGSDTNEVNAARATYMNEKRAVIKQITTRIESPFFNKYPDGYSNDDLIITIA